MLRTLLQGPDSRWSVLAVALAAVAMLMAFYFVVNGAATAGELRRQAAATLAAAVTRCRELPIGAISKNCLKALDDGLPAISPTVFAAQ